MTHTTPGPTALPIEEFFMLRRKIASDGKVIRHDAFNSHLAAGVEVVVTGEDHHLSGTSAGIGAFNESVRERIPIPVDYLSADEFSLDDPKIW